MAHPDSIKVIVEDAANISVTSSPTLGNVAVAPETPAVISINTNSAQVTLAELIGGDPQDGQVIVYDSTTNNFYYDYSSGGSGALTSDLQVTNRDPAISDAVGRIYEQNDSHDSIIRDILSPNSPVIKRVVLSWSKVSDGFRVPSGISSVRLTKMELDFMLPDNISSSSFTIYIDGQQVGVNGAIPSDFGNTSTCSIPINATTLSPIAHGTVVKLRIVSSYDDNGVSREYSYEDNIYAGRSAFIMGTPEESTDSLTPNMLSKIECYGVPFSDSSSSQQVVIDGGSYTGSYENYTWIAVPAPFTISTITEVVDGEGVANRTFSFSRIGNQFTYQTVNDAYAVYLYRSNQKGALSPDSSLKIKLNKT